MLSFVSQTVTLRFTRRSQEEEDEEEEDDEEEDEEEEEEDDYEPKRKKSRPMHGSVFIHDEASECRLAFAFVALVGGSSC